MDQRFTKEQRQQIVTEFCTRHNGVYNAALFFEEVRADAGHPAHSWFQWDVEAAFTEHNHALARSFASGLKVRFSIEEIGRDRVVTVRAVSAPLVLSPAADRRHGGGYHLLDPGNDDDMTELCRQAASALAAWARRFDAAIRHAGGSVEVIQKQVRRLEAASERAQEKVA